MTDLTGRAVVAGMIIICGVWLAIGYGVMRLLEVGE